MMYKSYHQVYDANHLRRVAFRFANKYEGLKKSHVYWIAKQLGIYPDGECMKGKQLISENKCGKITRNPCEYVTDGKMNTNGVKAIEQYITDEGYAVKEGWKEEEMPEKSQNIWEQASLISQLKAEYEKAVAERNQAKAEAEQYCQMADKYEQEIEDLKDKLLICEKENNDLKAEKKELSKMQIETADFNKEIDSLQVRIGKYSQEINILLSDMSVLRKEYSAMQVKMNQMQDNKKKLDGVLSDLVGCSKRLMNLK